MTAERRPPNTLRDFVSIDPGFAASNGTGWGEWNNGGLVGYGLGQSTNEDFAARIKEVCSQIPHMPQTRNPTPYPRVIEHMRIYPGPQQKGDQNDLLNLAVLEGALSMFSHEIYFISARSWKGQVPKAKMLERLGRKKVRWGDATVELRDLPGLPRAQEKRTSVIEGVSIGLWTMGLL